MLVPEAPPSSHLGVELKYERRGKEDGGGSGDRFDIRNTPCVFTTNSTFLFNHMPNMNAKRGRVKLMFCNANQVQKLTVLNYS